MRRAAILLVMAMAACGPPERNPTDANTDAPIDTPSGSGARGETGGNEASPKDLNLELGVIVVSLVVAVAPIRLRERRKSAM